MIWLAYEMLAADHSHRVSFTSLYMFDSPCPATSKQQDPSTVYSYRGVDFLHPLTLQRDRRFCAAIHGPTLPYFNRSPAKLP